MSCYYYNCKFNCCDYYGYCPSYSYNCYYYYNNSLSAGAIVGLVIGIICFIVFVALLVYLCRRCRERSYVPPPPPIAPPQTEVYVYNPNYPPYQGQEMQNQYGYNPQGYNAPYTNNPAPQPNYYGNPNAVPYSS